MKPTTEFTITTKSGRVLTEADIDRLAEDAVRACDSLALSDGMFLRDFNGGYESDIDGPMFAISLDSDLDARLAAKATELGESAAALMRRAVAEFVDCPPASPCPQTEAGLSGWQWLLHLDARLAERMQEFAACAECHINVVVNRAVDRLLGPI